MSDNSEAHRRALKDRLARSTGAPIEVQQLARAIIGVTDPSMTHD